MVHIVHSEVADNFNAKTKLLGINIDKQVELLNELYKDQLEFCITKRRELINGDIKAKYNIEVSISDKQEEVGSIILPECELLNINSLFSIHNLLNHKVQSVIIPKCIKYIELSDIFWVKYIRRLFVWDTTELGFNDFNNSGYTKLEMIIVKSSKNKQKIYRV